MIIFKSINELNNKVNFKANIGFVPTLGALHKGHISLIKHSKENCEKTLVSIFLNPTQFNNPNDLLKYPKNLKKDILILRRLRVDYLLIPQKKEIYKNKKQMKFSIRKCDKVLCAKYRPGHFEGVLAVIYRFLSLFKPRYLFLGEKDYQQIFLIKKYLGNKFNVKIKNCKTIRLKNSIPYSSRNQLISKSNLNKAIRLSKYVYRLYRSLKKEFNVEKFEIFKKNLNKSDFNVQYFEILNKNNLKKQFSKKNFKIFYSFFIDGVRLIDNF